MCDGDSVCVCDGDSMCVMVTVCVCDGDGVCVCDGFSHTKSNPSSKW